MRDLQTRQSLTVYHRGAVLSRLPNQASVVSTQAVRHYGVLFNDGI